ncbi:MAG: sulfate reduction electron transfer complex DsrMKJOP subunit DsrJ [Gemmatimonadota bacterium]
MGDRGKIAAGLAVFVILVTFPFWSRLAASGEVETALPELEYPAEETACVEETSFMTANHMDLLDQWRDDLVREGIEEYTATSGGNAGEVYQMSLTKTCLDCHESRDNFCNRCHDYVNVTPTCWECHTTPGGGI